jgi:hypothetical protein
MNAIVKEAGLFLVKEYGDDALRAFMMFVQTRRASGQVEPDVADAMQRGIEDIVRELNRPFDDFFGPRIGE